MSDSRRSFMKQMAAAGVGVFFGGEHLAGKLLRHTDLKFGSGIMLENPIADVDFDHMLIIVLRPCTLNQLYSRLMDAFDQIEMLDYEVPMFAQRRVDDRAAHDASHRLSTARCVRSVAR